jgi:hypothetical protein
MKNISYLILHYNRPYLLDINIKILRRYYPNLHIVVTDDGSHYDVVKKMKEMLVNDIFIQKSNKNTWKEGTCSNTIKSGLQLCKHEYMIFSEDDFFFVPYGVENYDALKNQIVPNIKYPKEKTIDIFLEAQNLLSKCTSVKNVALAKDKKRFRSSSLIDIEGKIKWEYRDHSAKKICYYSNWPSMTKTDNFRRVKIEKGQSIWTFEGKFSEEFNKVYGKGDWIAMPENRFYVHVGMPFSQRLNSFKFSEKRSRFGEKIQENIFNKIVTNGLEDFNKFLLKSWLKGRFFIDFDEAMETDLNQAFVSGFLRLSKYI